MFAVVLGRRLFSSVAERNGMGLCELSMSMSLLGFEMGDYVSQHPYV